MAIRFWRIVAGHPLPKQQTPAKSLHLGDWLRNSYISVGFSHHPEDPSMRYFRDQMKGRDRVVVTTDRTVWAVGEIVGPMITAKHPDLYRHRRNVRWYNVTRKDVKSFPTSVRPKLSNPRTIIPLSDSEWIEVLETILAGSKV